MRIPLPLAVLALAATAAAQTIVVPNGFAATEGNSSTAYPWQRLASVIHVQYCYDSTHFTNQGIAYPILINDLKWRTNGTTTLTTGGTYSNVVCEMSTSPLDQSAQTTTFATNHGADLATVFSGTATVQPSNGATPGVYYVDLPITPFLYDPSLGDLVIDVHFPAGSWTGTSAGALDCQTTGALVSRMYNLTSDTAPTGTFQANVGPVMEIDYNPASGLYSNFSANVTSGPSPLTVNFTDGTFSSDPGGVTAWAWDFDGDAIIDSTAQNPSFTYTTCGSFDVTLTTFDASHPPSTLTKTAFITTDNLTAGFLDQVIAPLTVSFTDTSNMPATAWAWDLDGDSIIDSTAQNPAWVYASNAPVTVTLTATRNCQSSTVSRTIVPEQQLTTNLAANNGGASLWTVYFNLNVTNPYGVDISSFDSITSSVSTAFTVDVYLANVGYSGNEYNPAPWTLVGTASGTSNATSNAPSNAAFPSPLHVPAGNYGCALRYTGVPPRYVTLTALATVANADLSLTLGSAAATTVAPFTGTTTTVNTPRMWSGTLYYGTFNITGAASAGFYGQGCAGTLGTTHQAIVSTPQLGGTLSINLDNMPFALGLMAVGATQVNVDIGFLGAPGCILHANPDVLGTVLGAGTTANWSFAVPNNPIFAGQQFFNQCAVYDPAANAFGFVLSDAVAWTVGL